jgi:hypothetical protein
VWLGCILTVGGQGKIFDQGQPDQGREIIQALLTGDSEEKLVLFLTDLEVDLLGSVTGLHGISSPKLG